jgi:hypothetical protein
VPLTKVGSDVMKALVTSDTGIPVAVTFTFNALTPPAGFKVTVNWDQTFQHYSSDEQFRAAASYFGWFGASYDRTVQKIREDLVNHGDIRVESISGETFTTADIEKYLQPILARINEGLIEAAKPPKEIEPAKANPPSAGGWLGSVGYSVAIKDVTKRKSGTEVWQMTNQAIVERKTIAQGFIGIGRFSEGTRNRLVTTVSGTDFSSAFFMLPSPAVAADLGVSQIDLQVQLVDNNQAVESQVVSWTPGGQWKDVNQRPRTTLAFGLAGLNAAGGLQNAEFRSKLVLTTSTQSVTINSTTRAANGQSAMPGVNSALFNVAEIDGSQLPFAGLGNGDVLQGNGTLTITGEPPLSFGVRTKIEGGKRVPPDPFRAIVARRPDGSFPKVTANIVLQGNDGAQYDWKHNGGDLQKAFGGLSISLIRSDFVKRQGSQ